MPSAGTQLQRTPQPVGVPRPLGRVWYAAVLILATLAFYNPIGQNGFIHLDDPPYILQNPMVRHGLSWAMVKWAFTSYWAGYWHPVTWISHALDCQLFGLNPLGHHYMSLLLHAANAILLFLILESALGLSGPGIVRSRTAWPSFVVAALFALHPVNVESVAWAAERKNVLSMTFFLLALLVYERYARSGRKSLYVGVAALFVLGLMAKPQVITLPCVLLLWDYWPLERMQGAARGEDCAECVGSADPEAAKESAATAEGELNAGSAAANEATAPRSFWFLLAEKIPLFVIAAAGSVVTVLGQQSGDGVRTLAQFSIAARVSNAVVSYVQYLGDAFWPTRLAPVYPHPETLPAWQVEGAAAILVAVTALVLIERRRRYLLVGWFWFLGTLVPMIGLVQVGQQARADRFAYLPLIGIFVAVVWWVNDVAAEKKIPRVALAVVACGVLATLGVLTYRQVERWHDDETLWTYTLGVTRQNFIAHDTLAIAYAEKGNTSAAISQFHLATAIYQYPAQQIIELASYEEDVGDYRDAIADFASVRDRPASDAQLQGRCWSQIGLAQVLMRDFDAARGSFEAALRLNANDSFAYVGLGLLARREGQLDAAVSQYTRAVNAEKTGIGFVLMAEALRQGGHQAEASAAAEQAKINAKNLNRSLAAADKFLSAIGVKR